MNDIEHVDSVPDTSTLEAVVVGGDLSRLSPQQRLEWYQQRCNAAGLDPRTQPFQYISLQGKLTLYATKAATDQLISSRGLTVEIASRTYEAEAGIYEVVCRVRFPDGRTVEDMAAVSVAGLKGDALANARMKCITKAKRRTVLSACGLGVLDESEVETISAVAHPVPAERLLTRPEAQALPAPRREHERRGMMAEAVAGLPGDRVAFREAVRGLEDKALAFLRTSGWLKPEQALDDLTERQLHTIVSKWDSFAAKIGASENAGGQEPSGAEERA